MPIARFGHGLRAQRCVSVTQWLTLAFREASSSVAFGSYEFASRVLTGRQQAPSQGRGGCDPALRRCLVTPREKGESASSPLIFCRYFPTLFYRAWAFAGAWRGLLNIPPRPMSAGVSKTREPIFNVPAVVVAVLAVLVLVHVVRVNALSPEADRLFVWNFAFVPARYGWNELLVSGWEYGWSVWTLVSYAFIHADITHLGFNAVWLLAFGSAVARRFGSLRFIAFFALTAAAGALAHLVAHIGDLQPMIGASGSISGTMGAATRFAFQRGGPLDAWRADGERAYRVPAAPLSVALRNPRVLGFLGAWFGLNLLFGLGSWSIVGEEQSIAWEAHVGGFLAGLFLFAAFDPVGARAEFDDDDAKRAAH